MTTPIARLVCALSGRRSIPKVLHLKRVQIRRPPGGHRREPCQAVEIIDSLGFADARRSPCASTASTGGLRDFGIDIGHMGFINGSCRTSV